jgi:mxaJ protein
LDQAGQEWGVRDRRIWLALGGAGVAVVVIVAALLLPPWRTGAAPPAASAAGLVVDNPVAVRTAVEGRPSTARTLRVCADPNNLPLSSRRRDGLENRLAALVAEEIGIELEFHWWPQRRGHVRRTLKAGLCDVIPGIASDVDMVLTTRPYYRSTYVFAVRAGQGGPIESWDDPRLRQRRVGVILVGDDYTNSPPAHALSRRGIVGNLVPFRVYEDYRIDGPMLRIASALEEGTIDVAVPWGPVGGWLAVRRPGQFVLHPVPADPGAPPMAYDISMGVRHGEEELRDKLDRALERRAPEIERLLDEFGVPRVAPATARSAR